LWGYVLAWWRSVLQLLPTTGWWSTPHTCEHLQLAMTALTIQGNGETHYFM
jgi:hypothetical protein